MGHAGESSGRQRQHGHRHANVKRHRYVPRGLESPSLGSGEAGGDRGWEGWWDGVMGWMVGRGGGGGTREGS